MTDSRGFNPLGGITVTGAESIEKVSLIALRGALKLEVKGFRRHGRPASVIANERMGTRIRGKREAYEAFDAWLVKNYGLESRPLEEKEEEA
jgi:hypothetical protein